MVLGHQRDLHQQLGLLYAQQLQQTQIDLQQALLPQLGHAQLFLAFQGGQTLGVPDGSFLRLAGPLFLLVQFDSQIRIVAFEPCNMDVASARSARGRGSWRWRRRLRRVCARRQP